MKRCEIFRFAGAVLLGWLILPVDRPVAGEKEKPRVLYFTRSVGFEHAVVHRDGKALSLSGTVLDKLGEKAGFEVECTEDGRVFDADLDRYDAIAFYTFGDLTEPDRRGTPPMSPEGKQKLLDAVADGKGFVGFHSTSLSFRSPGGKGGATVDPFIAMLGGELDRHGKPQEATVAVRSPGFPGASNLPRTFRMTDEWYVMRNMADNLHVILMLQTEGLKESCYRRPPTPVAWARRHGAGRVFFTCMGDGEQTWNDERFQQVVLGGLSWALGQVEADVTPNFKPAASKPDPAQKPPTAR